MDLTRRRFHGLSAAAVLGAALPAAAAPARTKLILLGTAGGPTPKPNRAAPSTAVVVDGRTYLVDAGNGTARQMAMAGLDMAKWPALLLTHHHSDHNADFGNLLLLGWAGRLSTPVEFIGPPPLRRMMRQFLALNQADIRTRMMDEGRGDPARLARVREITRAGVVFKDNRVTITAALVRHPPVVPSFAYRFDTADRSIVISGDTAPSDALVELARDADVLVHEVMYLPALDQLIASEPNAATLRAHLLASHTTTQQVGEIATRAGVKTLVLSHFVPGGFPFVPDQVWLEAVRPHFAGEIIVGRDLLDV
jgi:ribonuclease BN (tRNA processing enzyme)